MVADGTRAGGWGGRGRGEEVESNREYVGNGRVEKIRAGGGKILKMGGG